MEKSCHIFLRKPWYDNLKIADAERMGAISAMEASAARERAAQSMAPINAGLRQQVQASGMATAANANLIKLMRENGLSNEQMQSAATLAICAHLGHAPAP